MHLVDLNKFKNDHLCVIIIMRFQACMVTNFSFGDVKLLISVTYTKQWY